MKATKFFTLIALLMFGVIATQAQSDLEALFHDVQLISENYGLEENYVFGDYQYPTEYRIIDIMGHNGAYPDDRKN